MSPDVRLKSLPFMLINYGQYVFWQEEENRICCITKGKIQPWMLSVEPRLWIQNVSFIFTGGKPGGRRIWDSIYRQDGKPTQMSGVKNSVNGQVREVCSAGLWRLWQMGLCPYLSVAADKDRSWCSPASQNCFLLTAWKSERQQVAKGGIVDVHMCIIYWPAFVIKAMAAMLPALLSWRCVPHLKLVCCDWHTCCSPCVRLGIHWYSSILHNRCLFSKKGIARLLHLNRSK